MLRPVGQGAVGQKHGPPGGNVGAAARGDWNIPVVWDIRRKIHILHAHAPLGHDHESVGAGEFGHLCAEQVEGAPDGIGHEVHVVFDRRLPRGLGGGSDGAVEVGQRGERGGIGQRGERCVRHRQGAGQILAHHQGARGLSLGQHLLERDAGGPRGQLHVLVEAKIGIGQAARGKRVTGPEIDRAQRSRRLSCISTFSGA